MRRSERMDGISLVMSVLAMCVQLTWGILQTLIGFVIFLANIARPHRLFRSAVLTEWKRDEGVSLGLFIFVPRGAAEHFVAHEYGHCIQSMILGPLYLPLVLLPSLTWAGLPALERRRSAKGTSYYALFTERNANFLASYLCGLDPTGLEALKSDRTKELLAARTTRRRAAESLRRARMESIRVGNASDGRVAGGSVRTSGPAERRRRSESDV